MSDNMRMVAVILDLEEEVGILRGALEDILSADETSTLKGCLAIAQAAIIKVDEL